MRFSGIVDREESSFMGLCVTNKGGDVMLPEERINEWLWRREARPISVRVSLGDYAVVCFDTYDKSAIAAAERDICSRWFCSKLILLSTIAWCLF